MTVCATNGRFSSPDTPHMAAPVPGSGISWRVTYLRPEHRLTRAQAQAAVQLAAIVGAADEKITRRSDQWQLIAGLAAELGLDPAAAVDLAARPVRWHA